MIPSNSSFLTIRNDSEIHQALSGLVQGSEKILIKVTFESQSIFLQARASHYFLDSRIHIYLVFEPRDIQVLSQPYESKIVFQFVVTDKKVFGVGILEKSDEGFKLVFLKPLYSIQRRQHFRLRLPPSFGVKVELENSLNKKISFQVKDVSAGGILVEDSKLTQEFKMNQVVQGSLLIPGFENLKLEFEVLRAPTQKSKIMGLKIIHPNKSSERDLFAIVMNFYRKLAG